MSILKRITQMLFSRAQYWLWRLPNTKYNYSKDVGDGLYSSVFIAVIYWIMRRFAEAKMVIERDEEIEQEHDLLELMNKPNPFYSGRSLRMALALSYNIDGNAYMIKIRNNQLKPVQLWYVPHWLMKPHWPQGTNNTVFIDHYLYNVDGKEHEIDPEDVVHVRFGLDPNNVRIGMSSIKPLLREVFTDDEGANFTASLLRNFGIPGLIISPGSDDAIMDKGAPNDIKAFFKEKFGRDRRGEPLVMKSKTNVEQFGFDPKSLDLGKLRQIPEERVCAVLGVPAAVVGFGTGLQQTKVGATMKELRESAYEDCIIPMQNTFAEEFDNSLLAEFEVDRKKVHVSFDLSGIRVLQEDENKHAERVELLVGSSMLTIGEGRRELGYEVLPEHDVYIQKINIIKVPAGTIVELEPEPKPNDNGDGDGNGNDDKRKFFIPIKQEWRLRLLIEMLRDWSRLSIIWEKELAKDFKRLGRDVRLAWEKIVEDYGIEILSMISELKFDEDDIYAHLITDVVPTESYVGYEPHYLRVGVQTFETIETITGLGAQLTDVAEARIAASGGTRRGLVDLTKQTRDALLKAIAEGRALGEGPPGLAARIESQVAAGPWSTPEIRANVISRTETKYAQNVSSIEAYKTIPDVTHVQVVDAQLGETDDECMAIDGAIVTLNEAETLAIEEHPNGTRSFTPIVGDRERIGAVT